MSWILGKEFTFEAAHELVHHDGACARLHGHSFKGIVYVSSDSLIETGPKQGMVMDYSEIKKNLKPLVDDFLDHHYLNKTLNMESPTSESIAKWIYDRLATAGLRGLLGVQINETCTSRCLYTAGGAGSPFLSNAITLG